ncbi:MAG: helix-turn-helix transcriptional regulator [Flexilinea flocculi]|nr:helix-turn-helix transcriptional regulator [Flexilinea flocculi]
MFGVYELKRQADLRMEFNEKLQLLRKQKGLTQEELAEQLFVSRTAVSKWESNRGLPNIDSLKAISKLFSITIDELLSGDEILLAAEQEKNENARSLRTILYGLFDVMNLVFFFIPLFGEQNGDFIESVSLFAMKSLESYMLVAYVVIFGITSVFGIVEILLQDCQNYFWKKNHPFFSMALTIAATLLFILSQEPYIAFFQFWLLIIKDFLYVKQR